MAIRKLALGLFGAALIGGLVWFRLRPELPAKALALGGRLELAAGQVEIERDGAFAPAVSATPLADRGRVRTGKGSRALLRLTGGASAFLADSTTLALSGAGVSLESGRVWLDVPEVEQPIVHACGQAKVAVAGAGLSLARNGGRVEVYVARGLAVISTDSARHEVGAGERAVLAEGGELKIEPVAFWSDWTGGMADLGVSGAASGAGSGRLYAIDREAAAGTVARPLEIKRQAVRGVIADGIAETEVDQTFFNPGDRTVEGYYWFTVPETAQVTGFALETNGTLIEGEVVERREAVAAYEQAIERATDPALLEWINGRTYRARIHPITSLGTRRVVLRYVEPVLLGDGRIRYVYPMGQGEPEPAAIDEFSLSLQLGELGEGARVSTLPDARVEQEGRLVTMRRSVYTPRADFQVELTPLATAEPLRVTRHDAGGDQADFVMLRWVPDVDWSAVKAPAAELVLAIDTSAGGDEADRQLKLAVAEAVLRSLSSGDRFAVMTTDVVPRIVYPEAGLAVAGEAEVAEALERLASRAAGGATDLGALFGPGLSRLHGSEQPALLYVGDGYPTSGELRGEEVVERLRRSLEGARARFFSVGVGADANHPLLARLASVGGGSHFRVDGEQQAVAEALRLTAAVKTPTLTDLAIDVGVGLDEPLSNVAGKIARGQELMLLARTHHELPKHAKIRGRLGGRPFTREYVLSPARGAATRLVPRLWAAEFAQRIIGRAANPEDARGKVVSLAIEYGLVTPFSSILALDSEVAYQQMGIPRRRRPWDRLTLPIAARETTPAGDALAVLFAPVTLLSGCSDPTAELIERQEREAADSTARGRAAEPSSISEEAHVQSPAAAPPQVRAAAEPAMAEAQEAAVIGSLGQSGGSGSMYGVDGLGTVAARSPRADLRMQRASKAAAALRPTARQDATREKFGVVERPARRVQPPNLATCSDAASRSLADRAALWQRRLRAAHAIGDALHQYDAAARACELPGRRDRRALLSLIEPRATTAEGAELLFSHFAYDPDALALLARRVLRRTLDAYVAAVARKYALGGVVDWSQLDLELAAMSDDAARVARLRALLLATPGDPEAELRLLRLLMRAGKRDEALAAAARLRERGLLSPTLLRELGDVLVEAGRPDDALRTYTEIVEFDPDNPAARALVGDTLLANGWYEAAYRQFRTLAERTEHAPMQASAEIRLALAAAGAGRTDEALRILRRVAESDGEHGDADPRLHARLLSSALVARMLAEPGTDTEKATALQRRLKQLQVLPTPGRLVLLTWESLDASLGFGTVDGDAIDAASVGLVALTSPELALDLLAKQIARRTERTHARPVRFKLHEVSFDGQTFQVKVLSDQTG